METKVTQKIILTLIIILAILFIPNVVKAAYNDTFTTEDGIVVKKVITKFEKGSIDLDISNIN